MAVRDVITWETVAEVSLSFSGLAMQSGRPYDSLWVTAAALCIRGLSSEYIELPYAAGGAGTITGLTPDCAYVLRYYAILSNYDGPISQSALSQSTCMYALIVRVR